MISLLKLFRDLWENKKMVAELAKADFRKRFVGSYFGIVWMFVQPLVTIAIYAFIFGEHGMKNAPPVPNASYVIWLTPGMIPWFYFSESLNMGTGTLQEYNYLVKKVVFQVELLPVIKLVSCFMVHLCFMAIMFGLYLFDGRMPMASWIQVFYYAFALSMFTLALVYFTSSIQVFFKDMSQIVAICLAFGMWLTPIMYDEAIFTNRNAWIGTFFKINPFYYIAAGYRDSMLTGHWFWERPTMTVYFWSVTLILMILGLRSFRKLRPHFSDVL
ncbi:teichoic acid transport system permease protein [[Clostridium] aminophilum]|uniref:Transport permease protein n=1 Tax=[Clostridium] aminophilum TaxID=1526 RepID=A0A1I0GTV3_9FIRM|nr:ABC transporter permease [[Clostridium] aminophilum]SET74789.1 teichoic acid transport system permease protein [[Clostridium] aminophilum]